MEGWGYPSDVDTAKEFPSEIGQYWQITWGFTHKWGKTAIVRNRSNLVHIALIHQKLAAVGQFCALPTCPTWPSKSYRQIQLWPSFPPWVFRWATHEIGLIHSTGYIPEPWVWTSIRHQSPLISLRCSSAHLGVTTYGCPSSGTTLEHQLRNLHHIRDWGYFAGLLWMIDSVSSITDWGYFAGSRVILAL